VTGIAAMGVISLILGCSRPESIGEVIRNPRSFEARVVTIEGNVGDRVSLMFVKYFTLKDETGEIVVITTRILPATGARTRVKGKVQEGFTVGDVQMLVLIPSVPIMVRQSLS
jgi:hypothetical protein